jgi:two-component system OmpR family sensor kinase
LWIKLITAVLALVAVALVLISFVGISVLRSNLLNQVDGQLAAASGEIRAELRGGGIQLNAAPDYQIGEAVIWVPDRGAQQELVTPVSASGFSARLGGQTIPGPAIPADATSLPSDPQHAITVGSTAGGGRWRVIGLPSSAGTLANTQVHGIVVVATNASGAYHTISTLIGIDVVVSLVVLLALAAVGTAVVRVSLRPLTDIEQTAGAIAAGDLARRVPEHDPRTEVGRLGRSLNTMLAQIERAFYARAQSEFAARRSEERIRQFVADASHELRTPLTAIRGFAEYYRQRGGTTVPGQADAVASQNGSLGRADLDRIMRRVEQESARMGVLVEDMLLLARLDQQRPLEHQTVDLLTLAADAVHDARVVAPERSINLTVSAGAAPLVMGDEVRLRQVIGNLMSNALVHTPEGTPIEVRIRPGQLNEPQPGAPASLAPGSASGYGPSDLSGPGPAGPGPSGGGPGGVGTAPRPAAILEVADRGPGLTPEQTAHAFERFYRADQARTTGGTGLGLAIVAALVAAHGGAVWVESPPGGGAIFRIALPLAPEAIGYEAESAEHEDPGRHGDATAKILDSRPDRSR